MLMCYKYFGLLVLFRGFADCLLLLIDCFLVGVSVDYEFC